MLQTDLVIGTVKLALQECVKEPNKDIEMYIKYFKDKFYMLASVTDTRSCRLYTCNCENNFISFTDWLVDILEALGEVPKGFKPVYTYTFACIGLDLLQHKVHSDFNRIWLNTSVDKHKIAVSDLTCFRCIERLCSYFPVDVFNEQSEAFNALHTKGMSTRDNHDIHVHFLDNLLKLTYELSIQ